MSAMASRIYGHVFVLLIVYNTVGLFVNSANGLKSNDNSKMSTLTAFLHNTIDDAMKVNVQEVFSEYDAKSSHKIIQNVNSQRKEEKPRSEHSLFSDLSEIQHFTNGKAKQDGHENDHSEYQERLTTRSAVPDKYDKYDIPQSDLKGMIKTLVGEDVMPLEGGKRHLSGYTELLFAALQEDDEHHTQAAGSKAEPIPTIRTRDGIFSHEKILFNATTANPDNVKKIEIVMKMPDTTESIDSLLVPDQEEGRLFDSVVIQRIGDYLVFDVSPQKSRRGIVWIQNKILINGKRQRIHHYQKPIIVLYENLEDNPLFVNVEKRKRRDVIDSIRRQQPDRQDKETLCTRHDWNLGVGIFRWPWYLLPRHFNAGICLGDCTFPLTDQLNSTNYSFLKNMLHQITHHEYASLIPVACCVPVKYHPQTIIYVNSQGEHVIEQLPEMRVASCGCR